MCLLFRRRRFERNCRKSKWQPHLTFFSGWWLSHDWICWVMRCLLSQVILLEKIRETLGPQAKTNKECMHSGCRMIEYVEWWDACYLKSYCWKGSKKLWDQKQKQIQSACSQPPWKKSGVRLALAFSTIPFEAPPAEEQAHRLRLVFYAAQSRKWCWILFSFLFFSSKRGRRKSGRISCACNSYSLFVQILGRRVLKNFVPKPRPST